MSAVASDVLCRTVSFTFLLVTLLDVPLLFAIIPFALRFANHAHVTTLHRLAKQVVGMHTHFRILTRQVIFAIRLGSDGKVRQVVATDANVVQRLTCLFTFCVTTIHQHMDPVITQSHILRYGPIGSRNTKPRALDYRTIDGSAFG